MKRRDFLAAATACSAFAAMGRTWAADWPSQPVRIINPYPPGGIVDILARLVGAELAEALGQPFIVEDRPGAGGNIGTAFVARAQGDPYTLLLGASGPLAINVSLHKNLQYDPVRDFRPISLLAATPLVLVVSSQSGLSTFADLMQHLAASPKPAFYASAGTGTPQHLAAEMLKQKASVQATHVPYKGGAPAVVAVIGGEVLFAFENLALVEPHIRAGRMVALAVSSPARTASLPEVPTVREQGISGFEARGWYGLLAPAGIPDSVADRLAEETVRAARLPKVNSVVASFGSDMVADGPAAFSSLIAAEIPKWRSIVDAGRITLEG